MKKLHTVFRAALALAIAVALFAASSTVTAEFIKSYRAKRVITATAPDGSLFSSNYLRAGSEPAYATISIEKSDAEDESNTYFDTVVTICNYAQGNPTRVYNRTINYTLTASIVTLSRDANDELVITPAAGELPAVKINNAPMQASYSGSLTTSLISPDSRDSYRLALPRTMLTGQKYYVLLTATPTGGVYADLQPISALFDLAIKPEMSASNWHLEVADDRTVSVDEYSGYNYRLSGSGRGTILLGWDASVLELSKVFKQNVSAAVPSAGDVPAEWTGLTAIAFEVDSDNVNSYDIQFYLPEAGTVATWGDVAAQMIFIEDTDD
ncbi:MAG: hypothetical protein IKN53_05625 [Oscillibacter sp.]|nr:hypothetical protein [Oscillibacter sp.]